ncbi:MAG: OsmC family protein [Abditibacteriales bacterium]|nr:OsmC family protein [Abditibacteriales bacterium]MDW8368268.1 OsmC family protein [Abditibacteriales bacterium]
MTEEPLRVSEDIQPSAVCEGGNLDCGSGLLLLIRKAMNQVPVGGVLEIRSTEISVKEDLPAWCRMTQNPYLGWQPAPDHHKYFVRKGGADTTADAADEKARNYRWQCRVHWSGGLQSKVFCRNHAWEVGQPASFDVQDAAPSAVEYVLGALGACLAMGFQIHASRRGIQVDELEISLSGQIDNIFVFLGVDESGHSGFREIKGTLYVRADADEDTLQEVWQHTLATSPVTNTLTRNVSVDVAMRVVP